MVPQRGKLAQRPGVPELIFRKGWERQLAAAEPLVLRERGDRPKPGPAAAATPGETRTLQRTARSAFGADAAKNDPSLKLHTIGKMAGKDMVAGIWPVIEALRAGRNIERLLVRRDAGSDGLKEIRQLALDRDIPWQPVPLEKLDRLTRTEHQGVIALLSEVEQQDLDEVITAVYERGGTPLIVALDSVTDVRNMGAIARSAECFGADALLVPKFGTARLGPDAVKSSAGALVRKPVCRVNRLTDGLKRAREHGARIIACTEKGTMTLDQVDLEGPLVIVMGSEDEGISEPVLRMADELVKIPMAGRIGSLNVSVAAGIMLHEVLRQRLRTAE